MDRNSYSHDSCEFKYEKCNVKSAYTFGPALPPHMSEKQLRAFTPELSKEKKSFKSLEFKNDDINHNEDDNDNRFIGPLPVGHPSQTNSIQQQLECRSNIIRHALPEIDDSNNGKKREEWMTELPPMYTSNLLIGPRKFSSKSKPDMSDRSAWTDIPGRSTTKETEKATTMKKITRNEERMKMKLHRSNEPEKLSLLEMHRKNLRNKNKRKAEADKTTRKSVRRPFDRNIDMLKNQFDGSKKNNLFMKIGTLDRFCDGKL